MSDKAAQGGLVGRAPANPSSAAILPTKPKHTARPNDAPNFHHRERLWGRGAGPGRVEARATESEGAAGDEDEDALSGAQAPDKPRSPGPAPRPRSRA
ncbi:hypothetical protein ACOTEZ_00995, partial [Achromobacter xylosoxidans]